MNRCLAILAILAGLIAPAYGSGTIPYSLSQQIATNGTPLNGCKLYIYQAGTVAAPQNAYSDTGLTLVLPNPVICDAAGRLPQFFLADGLIKIRLTDRNGVTQVTVDNIQVIGASSGGGGGGSIDATTILATGDLKIKYGTGILSGFVRANGRTIGSATSGATERANADCQPLFEYLWTADPNLSVSGGRGASANADWVANKTINLPDARGRAVSFLDDMGSSARGGYTGATISGSATALGSTIANSVTIGTPNLPPYTPQGSLGGSVTVGVGYSGAGNDNIPPTGGQHVVSDIVTYPTGTLGNIVLTANIGSLTWTGNAQGGTSTPFTTFMPSILMTLYLKL